MFNRALIAFISLPGIVAFVAPPLLSYIDPWRNGFLWQGTPIMFTGVTLLLWCVRDFYVCGKGTLAPWDPPKQLVTIGLYRHLRNPMYIGVVILVLGWAIVLSSPILIFYSFALFTGFHIRVKFYEEPILSAQFGADWTNYQANVNRWLPRLWL